MKSLITITSLIISMCIGVTLYSQSPGATPAAMFLQMQTDARTAAMGGVHNISAPGCFNVFYNPSADLFSTYKFGFGAGASYRNEFPEHKLFSIAGYSKAGDKNLIALGIRYYNYPKTELFDNNNILTGYSKPNELSFDLGYARKIGNKLSISAVGRYIYSHMDDNNKAGFAIAADFGITYMTPLNFKDREGAYWSIAASTLNFGSKLKYSNRNFNLPTSIGFSSTLHLPLSTNHQITTTGSINYPVFTSASSAVELGLGAEYKVYKLLSLRAGYHISDADKGFGSYPTVGLGVDLFGIKADLSYWPAATTEREFRNYILLSLSTPFVFF